MRFTNRRVLVTGGAGGLGRALAEAFAREGAELLLTDREERAVREVADSLRRRGHRAEACAFDVTDERAVHEALEASQRVGGPLDVVINNAGVGHTGATADAPMDVWRRLWAVHVEGPLHVVHAVLPRMRRRGRGHLVLVSSGQAFFRLPGWGPYAASKAAAAVASETMAHELRREGIAVTTVYPYLVDTGFYAGLRGETLGARLAVRLAPRLADPPERVARRILEAVARGRRTELVNPLNRLGVASVALPPLAGLLGRLGAWAMAMEPPRFGSLGGFRIEEWMRGTHEFAPGFGPPGKRPMRFHAEWGPEELRRWFDPRSPEFLVNTCSGRIWVDGLCEGAPFEGRFELRYHIDRSVRYELRFEVGGERYLYVGEKSGFGPLNLATTHTTAFGTIVRARDGALVSRSVLRFRLPELPSMLGSLRRVRAERSGTGGWTGASQQNVAGSAVPSASATAGGAGRVSSTAS